MAEYNTLCLRCSHYDHFQKLSSSLHLFDKMCWTGKAWDTNCKCPKHIEKNLEYLEYLYEQETRKNF